MIIRMLGYGLVAGLVLCLPMFGPMLIFGVRPEWMKVGELVGYTAMVLCLSATWFAIRAEDRRCGPLGFGRSLGIGVGVSAVAGICFGLATWLLFAAMGDALPDALMRYYLDQIASSGAGAEEIARRSAELESMRPMFYNRPLQGAVMAATVFVIGVAESLAAAWWFSRRARQSGQRATST